MIATRRPLALLTLACGLIFGAWMLFAIGGCNGDGMRSADLESHNCCVAEGSAARGTCCACFPASALRLHLTSRDVWVRDVIPLRHATLPDGLIVLPEEPPPRTGPVLQT